MDIVQKAVEISNARIQFVSLVDKAANLRQFLVTKAAGGAASFTTCGHILKADEATHYITGVVYEPLAEDAHGNYMTEDEIRKAAYWYAENGDKVDIQHSFQSEGGLAVVENYVSPCDMTIGDAPVVKGSWVMTIKCTSEEVWEAVQKGELTGLSMGGVGMYSEEDTNLDTLTKSGAAAPPDEKRGIFKRLGELLGLTPEDPAAAPVQKGEVLDKYNESARSSAFWNAMYALQDVLYHYDYRDDRYVFTTDPERVREALEDFSRILTEVLTMEPAAIIKAVTLPTVKAGKKMSNANKKRLDDICQAITEFKSCFDEEAEDGEGEITKKEDPDMEDTKRLEAAIKKALEEAGLVAKEEPAAAPAPAATDPAPTPAAPAPTDPAPASLGDVAEGGDLEAAVDKAVRKALVDLGIAEEVPAEEPDDHPITKAELQSAIDAAVGTAVNSVLKARGIPTNLNATAPVEKAGDHYLHGFL